MTKPSPADFRNNYPSDKYLSIWVRYVTVPISFYIASILHKVGLSANQVTYLAIGTSFLGAASTVISTDISLLLGSILFMTYLILDGVDGNIARYNEKSNPYGTWVDNLGGYITYPLIFLSVGIAAESLFTQYGFLDDVNYIFVSAVGAISNLLVRNQHQKFNMINESSENGSDSELSIFFRLNHNIGLVGIMTPLLTVCVIFDIIHIYIILYSVYFFTVWIIYTSYQIYLVETYSG